MHARWVRIVFVVHGIVTAAAAVVLLIAPQAIPAAVGIALPAEANLIAYLLGAVELAIAVLSVATAWITDAVSVRVIALVFVIMHVVTAIAEIVVGGPGRERIDLGERGAAGRRRRTSSRSSRVAARAQSLPEGFPIPQVTTLGKTSPQKPV